MQTIFVRQWADFSLKSLEVLYIFGVMVLQVKQKSKF